MTTTTSGKEDSALKVFLRIDDNMVCATLLNLPGRENSVIKVPSRNFQALLFYMCKLFVGIGITVSTLVTVGVGLAEPLDLDKNPSFHDKLVFVNPQITLSLAKLIYFQFKCR